MFKNIFNGKFMSSVFLCALIWQHACTHTA